MSKNDRKSRMNDSQALDGALAGAENVKIARLVHALPDEDPSMAWRSALNEGILGVARRRRSRRFWARIWMPAAGIGTSVAVAASVFMLWLGKPAQDSDTPDLEASMVMVHRDNVRFSELAGPGLSDSDAAVPKQNTGSKDQWKESDLDAL